MVWIEVFPPNATGPAESVSVLTWVGYTFVADEKQQKAFLCWRGLDERIPEIDAQKPPNMQLKLTPQAASRSGPF